VSTILKALRRLEQERTKDGDRPLREQVVLSQARRRGPWAAWGAAGLALAVGFGATWLVLSSFAAAPSPDGPEAGAAPPAVSSTPNSVTTLAFGTSPPAAAAAPPPPPTPAPPPTVRVAAGAPPAATSPGSPPVAAPPPPAPAPIARSPASPGAAPLPPGPTPYRVDSPASPVAPRVDVPPPLPEASVVTAPIPGRAPRLVDEEPARNARADVPVDVVRTSWHPQASRRSAWVAVGDEDPREVREGDWVGAYEVRAIEPDGVLFADGPLLVHRPVGR
jgi:hypothetical protein